MNNIQDVIIYGFFKWLKEQSKKNIGNKILYDVKGYYKYLEEHEMLNYWLKNVNNGKQN